MMKLIQILWLMMMTSHQLVYAGGVYVYHYASDVTVKTDDKVDSQKSFLSFQSMLRVEYVWNSDFNPAEKLIRFQFETFEVKCQANSSSKSADETVDIESRINSLIRPFMARFVYGKLQEIFVDGQNEKQIDVINIQRGVVSLFQFQSGDWEGQEVDLLGSCWTTYSNDHHGLHKKKSKCQKHDNLASIAPFELFGVNHEWKFKALYHLQRDESGEEIISSAKVAENLRQEVTLHAGTPSRIRSSQTLQLKEQLDSEVSIQGSDLNEVIEILGTKEGLSFIKCAIPADDSLELSSQEQKFKNSIPKLKKNLRSASLAKITGAKAFLQARASALVSKTEDLIAVLKDKRSQDILLQLMDVLGSTGSVSAYDAVVQVFGKPSQTNRADLMERYLWSLGQSKVPETALIQELFSAANDKIGNLKLRETLLLTLGRLSHKTTDLTISTTIIKWIMQSMIDSCKEDSCIQVFLRAIENSGNVNAAPILLQLVEASKNKKTAFAAMKSFSHLMSSQPEDVKERISHFSSRLLTIYLDSDIDSSIRGIAAELILRFDCDETSLATIFNQLKSEQKGFASFVINRVSEFSDHDEKLKKLIRSCINQGNLDWNLLANGGLSTSFGRQVASAGKAGNASFSFAMEISGVILKRSNFQMYFQDKTGHKWELLQLGVFASGLSSYLDDSSKSDDSEEATAGIEIKFLGNQLRPFIFFSSVGELMNLYWSGASEQKNSALQGSSMLQNEARKITLSNGISASWRTEGVISYDFSGQAKVSMWTKQSETVIENAVAYVLTNKLDLVAWKDVAVISVDQNFQTELILKVENDLDFGSSGVKACIRVSQPDITIDHKIKGVIKTGPKRSPHIVETSKTVAVSGRTLFLNRANCDLCSKMYPKKNH